VPFVAAGELGHVVLDRVPDGPGPRFLAQFFRVSRRRWLGRKLNLLRSSVPLGTANLASTSATIWAIAVLVKLFEILLLVAGGTGLYSHEDTYYIYTFGCEFGRDKRGSMSEPPSSNCVDQTVRAETVTSVTPL
jgi:hypothetical protein